MRYDWPGSCNVPNDYEPNGTDSLKIFFTHASSEDITDVPCKPKPADVATSNHIAKPRNKSPVITTLEVKMAPGSYYGAPNVQ